ncbi:MAG TPA: hypothetical protein VK599_18330 [Streptosporangiaceae bacterium]|jgi:hypothetical protein|nr:hypothetical protein [Streptosporangiaceae bacterium]
MSGHEDPAAAPQEQPSLISRRSALRGGAATGIAGAALFAAGGPALAAALPSRGAAHDAARGAAEPAAHAAEPVIAHVRNARTGEIDVFRGTSQTRLHDPALAALLIRASH